MLLFIFKVSKCETHLNNDFGGNAFALSIISLLFFILSKSLRNNQTWTLSSIKKINLYVEHVVRTDVEIFKNTELSGFYGLVV